MCFITFWDVSLRGEFEKTYLTRVVLFWPLTPDPPTHHRAPNVLGGPYAQQKVLLSSFSALDSALVPYVLTAMRRGCLRFSTLYTLHKGRGEKKSDASK
jgi:hypothetical protein